MLPDRIEDLTPEMVTELLGGSGVLGDGKVVAVRADDIGTGVGVFGAIARLHLTTDGAPSTAPKTVVAKLPTSAEANRSVGMALRLYEREARFFSDVAPQTALPLPRCFSNESDVGDGRFVLLLEDLGHLEPGDQLAGLGEKRAAAILETMAAFHAHWWESPQLGTLDWMPKQDDPVFLAAVPGIVSAGVAVLPPLEGELPPGSIELARRVDTGFVDLIHRCAAGPHTMIHGDLRLDNLFFAQGTDDVTLIDWQLSLRNRSVYDLVWLVATSMEPELQNESIDRLITGYHVALARNGVDWSLGELRTAAAEQAAYLLSGPLSLIGTFDFSNAGDGRAAELTRKWVRRGFNAAFAFGAQAVV